MVQLEKKNNSRFSSIIIASHGKRICLWAVAVVSLASLIPVSQGCYLRNCPLGKREGKRTTEETTVVNTVRLIFVMQEFQLISRAVTLSRGLAGFKSGT